MSAMKGVLSAVKIQKAGEREQQRLVGSDPSGVAALLQAAIGNDGQRTAPALPVCPHILRQRRLSTHEPAAQSTCLLPRPQSTR